MTKLFGTFSNIFCLNLLSLNLYKLIYSKLVQYKNIESIELREEVSNLDKFNEDKDEQ